MSYKTIIRDVKTMALREAVDFVNNKMKQILKELTKEMHQILEQYLSFRQKTAPRLGFNDDLYKNFVESSIIAA